MEDNKDINFQQYKNLLDDYKNNYNDEEKNEILQDNFDILVIANYFKNINESSEHDENNVLNEQILNQHRELINELNKIFSELLFNYNSDNQFGGGFRDYFGNAFKKIKTLFVSIDKQDILNIINDVYQNESGKNPLKLKKNIKLEKNELTEFLNCFSFKNNKVDNEENDISKYNILNVINNLNNTSENSIILKNSNYNQYINKDNYQDNYTEENNDKFKDLFILYKYDIEFKYQKSAFSYQNFKNRLLNGPKNLAEQINKTLINIIYEYIKKRNAIFNIKEFKNFFQNINDSKIDIKLLISKDNMITFNNYKDNEFLDKIVELFKVIQKNIVKDDPNINILNNNDKENLEVPPLEDYENKHEETKPTEEAPAAPATPATPTEETPAAQLAPATPTEETPAAQLAPAAEVAPASELAPAVPAPAAEVPPAAEVSPAAEVPPAAEVAPASELAPAVPAPATEVRPTAEVAATEERKSRKRCTGISSKIIKRSW